MNYNPSELIPDLRD